MNKSAFYRRVLSFLQNILIVIALIIVTLGALYFFKTSPLIQLGEHYIFPTN